MLYLDNGVYFDMERMIVLKTTIDGKRPSIYDATTKYGMNKFEELTGVKLSVNNYVIE